MLIRKLSMLIISALLLLGIQGNSFAALPEYGEEIQNAPDYAPSVSFSDLPATHWAYRYIADMVNRKIIEGYPDRKFRPGNMVTRSEFATIIIKAAGIQAQKVNYSSFSDIKVTDWYSPFVESAKDYMTGYRTPDGNYVFNPEALASREDITVAIVKLKGYDVARLANRSIIEAMFKDINGISEHAKDYVAVAVENGLVSGYQDETFRAQNPVTRAEAATMLWRAFMYGNDNKDVGVGGQLPSTTPTPEPPATTKTPDPIHPQEPEQSPEQSRKFSVDTLVGGTGTGYVDGPVYKAKINTVTSLAVDKDDNIYFLDQADISGEAAVRKFHKSNGSVATYANINSDFDFMRSTTGNTFTQHGHNDYYPLQLSYNFNNNKLYLGGLYYTEKQGVFSQFVYDKGTFATIHEIHPPSMLLHMLSRESMTNIPHTRKVRSASTLYGFQMRIQSFMEFRAIPDSIDLAMLL